MGKNCASGGRRARRHLRRATRRFAVTGDPTTAYQNSVAMARDLGRARLLTVVGFGHTEFFNPSACANRFEFRYLLTGDLPPAGTVCRQTVMPFGPSFR